MSAKVIKPAAAFLLLSCLCLFLPECNLLSCAESFGNVSGGGHAATGQIRDMGYTTKCYDASNGLLTSDANDVLCAGSGYIWIGGYSGVFQYDGTTFTRMDPSDGLTSARKLFEDSRQRIWVGTNDNGVVVIEGNEQTHLTYQDGLPASSIRSFAEDPDGNVYIGTTAGLCYADAGMQLHGMEDKRLDGERILRLESDTNGLIYGQTQNGSIFRIASQNVTEFYESGELSKETITTLLADPLHPGYVYLGTNEDVVYYGAFGDPAGQMERISVSPLSDTHWISYDCGRVWVSSATAVGYLDENNVFHILDDLAVSSGIEMSASDYQGNMWFASSRQGVMKLAASSFVDVTGNAGLSPATANAACLYNDMLYIGTDNGLRILDQNGKPVENDLTVSIGSARIRSIASGKNGELWVGTFTDGLGLLCVQKDGSITAFTQKNGMPSDEIRCISVREDGTVLAGTNHGLAVICNGTVTETIGADDVANTVFLDVEAGENGEICIASDGGGIYIAEGTEIRHIGRDDGLTSDIVNRIKRDDEHGVYWLITSNSIEYLKDGSITCVSSFPYHNNYDLYFGSDDRIWVISSCGIFAADAEEMLQDCVSDYQLYTTENGLSGLPSSYAFCALKEDGTLYIPEKNGVCSVNIRHFSERAVPVKAEVSSVYFGDEAILPDPAGNYTLPEGQGRIRITASVMDYSLQDPQVQVYFEGKESDGIHTALSSLTPLEYTDLEYGKHVLHIRVTDSTGQTLLTDKTIAFLKRPRATELPAFRLLMFLLAAALVAVIIWRAATDAVMRRQNEELRRANEKAETANREKNRFLSNLSHEILTPINTIIGMNELTLREDTANVPAGYCAAVRNNAVDIRNASEALKYFISDLLDMSAVETGQLHIAEQEYDLCGLLHDISAAITARSREKGLEFNVDADEMMPSRLFGDAEKIKHILMSLLLNSIKYTDTGSILLRISAEERVDTVCVLRFSVKDTGIGFNEEVRNNLLRMDGRLNTSEEARELHTELGLNIANRFARLMNGTLVCESEPGRGTEFVFTVKQEIKDKTPIGIFKLRDENAAAQYIPLFKAPDADVLVVSNDTMTVKVIKGLLKATEVFVTTASNPEECTDKMLGTRFDVILFDLKLGDADGKYPEKLRRRDAAVPVYAINSHDSADDAWYKTLGYQGCLFKPIDGLTLERTIMRHLSEDVMERTTFSRR